MVPTSMNVKNAMKRGNTMNLRKTWQRKVTTNLCGHSSVVEHLVANENVGSSNLPVRSKFGAVAQLGVQFPCTEKVGGSSPLGSTKLRKSLYNVGRMVDYRQNDS